MSESLVPNAGAGWEVEEEIGRGAMGVVWRARQASLDRPAAVKRLRKDLVDTPEAEERMLREARLAARIHHPNVVAVYDCFRRRGVLALAQEWVDGPDLRTALAAAGAPPPRIAGLVALEILRGLEAIHERAAVHRDLKPANVLIGRRGDVKIGDFGVAFGLGDPSLTRTGVALGTPAFMAPEQLAGGRGDPRADVYAFGAILYELLSGRPAWPHEADGDADELLERKRRERYAPLRGAPPLLARTVRRCLRPKPERRPGAAELRRTLEARLCPPAGPELRAEIAGWLRESGAVQPREDETIVLMARGRGPRRVARRLAVLAAAVALLTAAAVGLGFGGDLPQPLAALSRTATSLAVP